MNIHFENSILYIMSIGGPTVLLSLSAYFYFKTRLKERLALIEKGKELPQSSIADVFTNTVILKLGLYLIGLSFGMITGILVIKFFPMLTKDEGIAWGITIPFFLGISLLLSNFLNRSKERKE